MILKLLKLLVVLSLSILFLNSSLFAQKKATIIKLTSDGGQLKASSISAAVKKAEEDKTINCIILDINANSGTLDDFKRFQKSISKSTVPIYAYINQKALGASAGLVYSCKEIYMHPDAMIGAIHFSDKEELSASEISIISASLREQARKNGYEPELPVAMIDKDADIQLKINDKRIVEKGQVLTLTSKEASQKINDKEILSSGTFGSIDDLLKHLELDNEKAKSGSQTTAKTLLESPMPKLTGIDDKYLVVELREEFSPPLLYSFRKAFQMIEDDDTIKAMIIDMHTPGGYVQVLLEIMGLMNECKVPVYVFVNTEAISAGALLTFASDGVYMKDMSVIGSAAVVNSDGSDINEDMKKKILAFIEAKLRANADNKGFRYEVARAMIDSEYEYYIDDRLISKKGELLTITGKEAAEIMPDGRPLHAHGIVNNMDELIALKGLNKAERIEVNLTSNERVARFLIFLSPFLMMVAMACLFAEMQTPGFGMFGGIAIVAFACVVFAQYVAGTAASWEIIIVFVGFILLLVELFIIPGFGFCGIAGICSMLFGFVLMMIPHIPALPDMPEFSGAFDFFDFHIRDMSIKLLLTIFMTAIAIYIIRKIFPHTSMYNRLVLAHATTKEAGYSGTDEAKNISLVGLTGVCDTDLRPSGIAIIDNRRVDVVSQGRYIEKGTPVKVKKVEGVRVVVVPDLSSESKNDSETDLENPSEDI